MTTHEFTTTNEREAHSQAARLAMTEGITSVSLVGFDTERGVYAFNYWKDGEC